MELSLAEALREFTSFRNGALDLRTDSPTTHIPSKQYQDEFLRRVELGDIKLIGQRILADGSLVAQRIPPILSLSPYIEWEFSRLTDGDAVFIDVRATEVRKLRLKAGRPSQKAKLLTVVNSLNQEFQFRKEPRRSEQYEMVRQRAHSMFPDIFKGGTPSNSSIQAAFRAVGLIGRDQGR